MARNTVAITATPEDVFDVLIDPGTYADWVVGAKEVRTVDDDWPTVGSRFHHTQGAGPFGLRDYTELEALDRPRRIVLLARARPATDARVELHLRPGAGGGTEVETVEEQIGAFLGASCRRSSRIPSSGHATPSRCGA